MLTEQEARIIDSYPLRDSIYIQNYIKDFIYQNPLNFPYTSAIMSNVSNYASTADGTVADIYTEDKIKYGIEHYSGDRYGFKSLVKDCTISDQVHFTLIIASLLTVDYENITMKIFKLKNNTRCYLFDGSDDNIILIDDNMNCIVRVAKKYLYDVNEVFLTNGDIESINDFSDKYLMCAHYKIPIGHNGTDKIPASSMSHKILVIACLLGNENAYDNIGISNIIGDYTIFRNRCYIPNEYMIAEKVTEKNPHLTEVCDKDLLNTKVVINAR